MALHPKGEGGSGLIAALVVTAVVGVLASGLSLYFDNITRERKVRMIIRGRDVAYDSVRASASSPDALYASSLGNSTAGNAMLKRCIQAGGGNDCTATSPARAQEFVLFVPFSRNLPKVPVSGTGPADLGGHYTSNGFRARCKVGIDCPYWARTVFWAQCPNNAGSCPQATRIFVRPQILTQSGAMDKGSPLVGAGLAVRDQPTATQIAADPRVGATDVLVSDILQRAQVCPTGAYVTGVSSTGMIRCKCDQGFIQTGADSATGWPFCVPLAMCTKPKVLVGTMADGQAYCRQPPQDDYECSTKRTPSSGQVSCNPGERMKGVQTNQECLVKNDIVTCDDMTIQCCKPKKKSP